MDKITIIDAANQIYRASVSFAPKKTPAPIKNTWEEPIQTDEYGNPKPEETRDTDEWGNFTNPGPTKDIWGFDKEKLIVKEDTEDYTIIYNFFRSLRVQIEQFQPAKCFVALEGHPQFRYDLYPEYKANRLIKEGSQLATKQKVDKGQPEILRLLKMLPITQVRAEKYEADDVVYSLVDNMKEEEITVISSDKDFIQLTQKGYQHFSLFNPLTKSNREAPIYEAIAHKSLMGDSSDNIKGLVGKKKAETLASNPEKLKEFLEVEENRALFNINRSLIELRLVPLEELIIEEGITNFDELKKEFEKMQFETMIAEPYWSRFRETFSCLNL